MTVEDIETAIRDAGCGWDQPSQALVLAEKATPDYCNAMQCKSLLAGAIRSVSTAEDVGEAALALATGNSLAAELAAARDYVGASAARQDGKVLLRAVLAP